MTKRVSPKISLSLEDDEERIAAGMDGAVDMLTSLDVELEAVRTQAYEIVQKLMSRNRCPRTPQSREPKNCFWG